MLGFGVVVWVGDGDGVLQSFLHGGGVLQFLMQLGDGFGDVVGLLVAGVLRFAWGYWLGWAVQVAALAVGFQIGTMFFLGGVFLALWATAYFLGRKIEVERAEWERTGNYPGAHPS